MSTIKKSQNNTFKVPSTNDINSLTEDTTPDLHNDYIVVAASDDVYYKTRAGNLPFPYQITYAKSDGKDSTTDSTAATNTEVKESRIVIPPLKTYSVDFRMHIEAGATTTGMYLFVNIDANGALRGGVASTVSSSGTGQTITFNGDSTVITAGFTGTYQSSNGNPLIGYYVVSNTHSTDDSIVYLEYTTEVDTSYVRLVPHGATGGAIHKYWHRITELE